MNKKKDFVKDTPETTTERISLDDFVDEYLQYNPSMRGLSEAFSKQMREKGFGRDTRAGFSEKFKTFLA